MKVLLSSRREDLQPEIKSELMEALGAEEVEITHEVTLWQSSGDEADDNAENALKWLWMAENYGAVVGVFPPQGVIALHMARGMMDGTGSPILDLRVFTPISTVSKTFGGGSGFRYLRLQEI